MKTLVILIGFVFLSNHIISQSNVVNVDFEVDGKPSVYKNATVEFFYNKDTLRTKIENGKLAIPDDVIKKKATVVFYFNQYFLKFDSIPVTLNSLSPKWTLGIDKKPFNKKKMWMIKSWRKVEIIYYLKNDDGRILTVDYYKKSAVVKRNIEN